MNTEWYREALLETVIDAVFDTIEAAPEVHAALAELRRLAPEDRAGRGLVDAAMNYATALARRALLAGLVFDVRAKLDRAVAEKLAGMNAA